MSELMRDGTAKSVPRESKFSGANRDRKKNTFFPPIQLTTNRVANYISGSSVLCGQ